jgi:TPR repeat protein
MWLNRAIWVRRWDRRSAAWTTASSAASAAAASAYCYAAATATTTTTPATAKFHRHNVYSQCEGGSVPPDDRLRKRATVTKANARRVVVPIVVQRASTREELSKLRSNQDEMLRRWERDEDGWRELPARAWPEYQPNPEQLKGIQKEVAKNNCSSSLSSSSSQLSSDPCRSLLFSVATAQVFYNVDPTSGFEQYKDLAQNGHVDSMVACGIILVEGFGGTRNREEEGVAWLKRAVSLGSSQALYELGTVYYTGIDGVVPEEPETAYIMFEKAAAKGHVGAMYMMADCLMEGEGTKMDAARAVPLLYQAADQGHRYARQ